MDFLNDFELKIYMYDGMITEMGRDFAQENCKDYICKCLDSADLVLKNNGSRDDLIRIIDKYISVYSNESDWELNDLEMDFLTKLRGLVAKI
jgi:hypothetical protein